MDRSVAHQEMIVQETHVHSHVMMGLKLVVLRVGPVKMMETGMVQMILCAQVCKLHTTFRSQGGYKYSGYGVTG